MRASTAVPATLGAIALALLAAAPASADPTKGEPFALVCDNGVSYEVTVAGNGNFTPAHAIGSTTMLIPTSFGPFTGTMTAPDGTVETFTDPPVSKGSSTRARATTATCTFHFEATFDGSTFVGDGSVTGFVTPAR